MIPLALMALMQGGGQLLNIFGKKHRKEIDPEFLKRTFGAGAVNKELMELYNRAINSVQGQQLMTQASQTGQNFQNAVNREAGAAGLGAGGGASGGANIFASGAGSQAAANLQGQEKAGLMQSMLPVAQNLVGEQLRAYMGGQEMAGQPMPSPWSDFGNLLANYGNAGITSLPTGNSAGGNAVSGTGNAMGPPMASLAPTTAPGGAAITTPGNTQAAAAQPAGPGARAIAGPSMRDIQQQQMVSGMPPRGRFMSRMSRFSGMSGAVQQPQGA